VLSASTATCLPARSPRPASSSSRSTTATPERQASFLSVSDFTADAAFRTGLLRLETRRAGLSLADRACLALAQRLGVPAVTADRTWAGLDVGVEVTCIR